MNTYKCVFILILKIVCFITTRRNPNHVGQFCSTDFTLVWSILVVETS
jgi:hypothetical protein